MTRRAASTASVARIPRRLPSGDPSEYRTYGHAQTGQVAFSEDVARHDFARRVEVAHRIAVFQQNLRLFVHPYAKVGKGDAWAQGVAKIGRSIDRTGPMGFRWVDPRGRAGTA